MVVAEVAVAAHLEDLEPPQEGGVERKDSLEVVVL